MTQNSCEDYVNTDRGISLTLGTSSADQVGDEHDDDQSSQAGAHNDGDEVEEMLSDTFLNPSEITLSLSLASAKVFKTTGARNCDKVNTWIGYYPKNTKDTIMEWIQWKQKESGSRRHLILFYGLCWSLVALTAYQEMLEDLKNDKYGHVQIYQQIC
ncbi:hypothetical protein DdX_18652 [Ditylenchus destructor]|uniref:Uncharacterized protein n=1 Tax=Ditylenchus destructor TaxID=166010 RepID=A0AAD4MKH5_9BILA|nr:hypothetical protein DdX_18652 [Ditylenchus destructor]